jgi:hypothetical protein
MTGNPLKGRGMRVRRTTTKELIPLTIIPLPYVGFFRPASSAFKRLRKSGKDNQPQRRDGRRENFEPAGVALIASLRFAWVWFFGCGFAGFAAPGPFEVSISSSISTAGLKTISSARTARAL